MATEIRPTERGIMHRAPTENLEMNKYHFLYKMQEVLQRERRIKPRGQWSLGGLGIFMALVIPVFTSDFHTTFQVEGGVWKSVTIICAGLAGLATIGFFGWWIHELVSGEDKTPREILAEVLKEMAEDTRAAAEAETSAREATP